MNNPYFNLNHWLKEMGAENQQAQIFVKESDEIMRKLSLKSSQGGYKVMIIWLPEKMNVECSNKLLKLLEEPPVQTVFLLVSEEPDALLQTIQSRTQRFNIHGIDEAEIAQVLQSKYGLQAQDANDIAHRSEGNFLKALFITEKPSVAREFAAALNINAKNRDGYMEGDKAVITWCVGHLVTMSYPDQYDPALKKWDLETIPFTPRYIQI